MMETVGEPFPTSRLAIAGVIVLAGLGCTAAVGFWLFLFWWGLAQDWSGPGDDTKGIVLLLTLVGLITVPVVWWALYARWPWRKSSPERQANPF